MRKLGFGDLEVSVGLYGIGVIDGVDWAYLDLERWFGVRLAFWEHFFLFVFPFFFFFSLFCMVLDDMK